MRAYPHYRGSGAEWLGEVPEHWQSGALQRWFTIVNGGTPASAEETYWDGDTVWLTPDDLGQNEGAWIGAGRRTITEEGVRNSSARVTPAGSIVLSTRAPIGHLAITGVPAATNQGCRTLVPADEADGCFAYYALLASRHVIQSLGKGSTFMELTPTDLGGHAFPLPPLDEQRAIAAYLDRETERIDALVAKKRLLIERLEEYRAALITRTVTRGLPPEAASAAGLDPSPRFKPSGVEWLGEVPEQWKIQPLRSLASLRGGATPDKSRDEFWDGDIPWVSPKDMKRASISDSEDHVAESALDASSIALLPIGSVLVVVRGMILAHSFPVAVTASPVTINQDMKALITTNSLQPEFLYWYLVGREGVVVSLCEESAHGTRRLETLRLAALPVAVPPGREQRAIVTFLDHETQGIDELTNEVETAVQRLLEYRTALITAAVTGKIDVREPSTVDGPVESPS